MNYTLRQVMGPNLGNQCTFRKLKCHKNDVSSCTTLKDYSLNTIMNTTSRRIVAFSKRRIPRRRQVLRSIKNVTIRSTRFLILTCFVCSLIVSLTLHNIIRKINQANRRANRNKTLEEP